MASHITVPDLLDGGWRVVAFRPFRPGVAICPLVEGGVDAAGVALLRYDAGASVPFHRHLGLETILVLDGSQCDESGRYEAGTLAFNAAGSSHSVWSEDGCVVLIQWERPVEFINAETKEEA